MTKKGQKPPVNNTGPLKWEQGLIQAQLQEENWKVCIGLLIENKLEDAINVNHLNSAIATGSRRLFDKVTRQNLFREVYIYGNPKNRPKEIPLFAEVCEACKVHLDNKEDIPDLLLAKLIKYKLLSIKADDIKRRQLTSKDPDAGKNKPTKAPKSAGKKGAAKKSPDSPSAKQGTLLKKRSEENLDQKFIDDEPDDGPQHYIIISGFYHTKLLTLLSELDINIDTVIRYGCSDYDRFLNMLPEKDESLPKDSRLIAAEEAAAAENIRIKRGTETFWKEIFSLLMSQPLGSPLFHTHVQDLWVQEPMPASEKSDMQVIYCASLFDNIAHLLYDLVDSKRQYDNYIKNMKIITVPDTGEVVKPGSAGISDTPGPLIMDIPTLETQVHVDARYYNDLMDSVPLESVTIPLIVHCLIEQVVATEEHIEPPSEKVLPPTSDGLHQEVADHLGKQIQKLSMDEECLSSVTNMIPEQKVIEKEKLEMINYNDNLTKKLHHLVPFHEFDPEQIEAKILQKYFPYGVHLFPKISDSEKKTLLAQKQEFLYFCRKKDLSIAVVDNILCHNVLECISLNRVNADGNLEFSKPTTLVAWDYPYKFLEEKQLIEPDILKSNNLSEEASLSSSQESYEDIGTPNTSPNWLRSNFISQTNSSIYLSTNEKRGSRYASSLGLSKTSTKECLDETYKIQNTDAEDQMQNSKPCAVKVMDSILSSRQRNLENWNYIEHFEPNIFQQVLHEAAYMLPYCETYYHHRNNDIYILLYNPYNADHWNKESWKIQLHSNVGFRNYMLHVATNIQEWIQEEEKKYEALLDGLQAEKLRMQEMAIAEAALAEQLAEKAPKDGKKTPSKKTTQTQSRSPTRHENMFSTNGEFIRQGSLKALKREEDLMKLEEEEKEKKKGQKAPKKVEKSAEKEQTASPVTSLKSNRPVKTAKEDSYIELASAADIVEEKELPFTGYDMGNNIISLTANTYTLFPSDGAQIRVETTEYLYGCRSVKCSVLKNGHVFTVHLLNPRDVEEKESIQVNVEDSSSDKTEHTAPVMFSVEKEKNVKKETSDGEKFSTEEDIDRKTVSSEQEADSLSGIKYSDFGSISAVLSDGTSLSFSKFGPTGYYPHQLEKKLPLIESPKQETPSVISPREISSARGKKTKLKHSDSVETIKVSEEVKELESEVKEPQEEPAPQPQPQPQPQPFFQNLYLTCPDGLKIEYFLENSYGIEPIIPNEHRILVKQSYPFRSHGIQSCDSTRNKHAYLEQHRIIISDGTVIKKMKDGSFEVLYVDGTVAKLGFVSSGSGISGGKKIITEKMASPNVGPTTKVANQEKWTITHPSGQKFILTPDGKKVNLPRVLFSMKSDIKSGQTVLTRDDHVILLSETSGKTIVEHADGTRITSYYEEMSSSLQRDNKEPTDESCKRMFIMVECPSFATVKFNSKTSENLTLLADGTLINVFPDGYYSLLLAGENTGDRLYLDLDGTLSYASALIDYPSADPNQSDTMYTFQHNDKTICETVDPNGTIFKVDHKGQHTIIKDTAKNDSKMYPRSSLSNTKEPSQVTEYRRHSPRIFVLHPDGSGGEILPNEKVKNYLNWSEKNPDCITLKDMFQDQDEIYGITLLKPYKPFPNCWLKDYELECIIPESIRLQTSINPDKSKYNSVKCPDILEIRQFTQYPQINKARRETIEKGMHDYIDYCFKRCKRIVESQVMDDRPEKEKNAAENLQEDIKHFDWKDQLRPQLKISEAKDLYEQGITNNQSIPVVEQKLKENQNVPNIEKTEKDYLEEEMAKKALRNQEIPKYFDSMFGKAFLETQQMKKLDSRLKKLCDFPVFKSDAVEYDSSHTGPVSQPRYMTPSSRGHYDDDYQTSRELRPVNPSPSHAKGNASPSNVRPTNPTPNLQKAEPMQERPVIHSFSTPSYRGTSKNLYVDVNGQIRSTSVPVPNSLLGGRPHSIPNQKFQNIEEPVRRQIHNSLTTGSALESQWRLKMMRGLNLYPEEINFGVLCEGHTYMMSAYLINTGVDSCHFKIKQPPPATGLQVTYQAGPVAAGLKRKLKLELFAIAVGANESIGVGSINHNLCITTETDIIYLPIQATILTSFEYDQQISEHQLTSKSTNAKLISTVPPGTQGIIRPKKKNSKGQVHQ